MQIYRKHALRHLGSALCKLVALAALVAALSLVLTPRPASALIEIDVTRGVVEPIPVAMPTFAGADANIGSEVVSVALADLERSGLFKPVNPAAFIQRDASVSQPPRFTDWRPINAQVLVVGEVTNAGGGRVQAGFRIWDVFAGEQIGNGWQFTTRSDNVRRLAHLVADTIYEQLTGEKGYFDTRVVFVAESGAKKNRAKRLAIMDQDGANVRYLTDGSDLVLTPRFSPTNQQIAYMAYPQTGQPQVFLLDVESGRRQLLGNFPNMTFSPRFSPDGSRVVMSLLDENGNADINVMNIRSGQLSALTRSRAIDTSPSYSPDGSQIVFESDRGGSQQLYVISANGGNAQRISFKQGRYATPVWSPRGDLIAFTKQLPGKWLIGVMKPDGSGERILTEGFHNEGPTWAPNGRVLMFFRDVPGANGGPQLWTVDLTGRNERRVETPNFASDPAWSPRLSE